jgi:hypothetical protein
MEIALDAALGDRAFGGRALGGRALARLLLATTTTLALGRRAGDAGRSTFGRRTTFGCIRATFGVVALVTAVVALAARPGGRVCARCCCCCARARVVGSVVDGG